MAAIIPTGHMGQQAEAVADAGLFSPDELRAIYAGNAAKLMPRYA